MDSIKTAKIFSTLGNNHSLIPLGIKDVGNTAGVTIASFITGKKTEGTDRFIDEFGTQLIWLLGVPFFKKVIDKTLYKLVNFNPNIDVRILNNQNILKKAQEHSLNGISDSFEKVIKNQKLFKGLGITKFILSSFLTLSSYAALTKYRHKKTEDFIIKEIKEEEKIKKSQISSPKNVSFGNNFSLSQFMFDPVKNAMIIDGGISAERLGKSRNPQDFFTYLVKESGFWAFMYFAGPSLQKHLEKKSEANHLPINIDIRVLQNPDFKKSFADKSIEKELLNFSTNIEDDKIYESLFKKNNFLSDNLVVKMAKESGFIKTVKDETANKELIDTQFFININSLKDLKIKIQKLYSEFCLNKNSLDVDTFFTEITKLKRQSIIKNIGFSVGALGLLIPSLMVALRFSNKQNKDFQVKKDIYEKMKKDGVV